MSRHLISFKPQFPALVESGQKRQTIRAPRKRQIKVGDTLILATGVRTKHYRRLGEATCVDSFPIRIHECGVKFPDRPHWEAWDSWAVSQLARMDGFRYIADFRAFFETQYGFPFDGVVIRWGEVRK